MVTWGVKVVRSAPQNAASTASLLLTTEAVISQQSADDKTEAGAHSAGAMGGGCPEEWAHYGNYWRPIIGRRWISFSSAATSPSADCAAATCVRSRDSGLPRRCRRSKGPRHVRRTSPPAICECVERHASWRLPQDDRVQTARARIWRTRSVRRAGSSRILSHDDPMVEAG
jgi:hypothetical protein